MNSTESPEGSRLLRKSPAAKNVKITAQLRKTSVARSSCDLSRSESMSSLVSGELEVESVKLTNGNLHSSPSPALSPDQHHEIDECLQWIEHEQNAVDSLDYGANKRAVDDTIKQQKSRVKIVQDYRGHVDDVKDIIKDKHQLDEIENSFSSLSHSASKQLGCLESVGSIAELEQLFGVLPSEFSRKVTSLVEKLLTQNGHPAAGTYHTAAGTCVANTAQSCILATRNMWSWMATLLSCTQTHLHNTSEYHQFFHDVHEFQCWMPAELGEADELLSRESLRAGLPDEIGARFVSEIKKALVIFLHWRGKMDTLFERSRKVIPVSLRTQKLLHDRPVQSLANYKTNEMNIAESEDLTLLDNTNDTNWKVKNIRGQCSTVPSTIILIPGPDPTAAEAALKLRLQFLSTWTNCVKRFGKTIIAFLLSVFKNWIHPDEEQHIISLNSKDKDELCKLLVFIEDTFSTYWSYYPPYQTLANKMEALRSTLAKKSNTAGRQTSEPLDVHVSLLEELLARFRDLWMYWEKNKVLTETCRHPEYLLAVDDWQSYNFLDTSEWLKKWQVGLEFDETDGLDELEDDVYTIETAKETAETSHLTTSEQEERHTFTITGVIDPRNGEEISLDRAVSLGIINQKEGKYVNPRTRETIPIPLAMEGGKIKVEYTTTNKSAEKRSDIGWITIKTYQESRPFTVQGVIDVKTEKKMTVEEAIKCGILDMKRGVYTNLITKEELSLADALDSGLLIVEFENELDLGNNDQDVITKTYAIHEVYDSKKGRRVTFTEAMQAGLIDTESGAFYNNLTGEYVYVGDAVKAGLIKAIVVNDPKVFEVASTNRTILSAGTLPLDKLSQSRETNNNLEDVFM